ncbi:MAG TPA: cytochrome P450 [Deltaproteobacteria bacterium]|jgi:cholest-4-en-3-one 26-monooxygenase|nr:cytochrome P450 [Deltaproteobacteria bacterium]
MKLSDVDLYNPDNFVREVPHEMFRVLRREAPVYFHPEPDGPGFWVLTKYEDVKSCSRNPQLFSSWLGGTNIPDRDGEQLDRMRVLMLNMDPPKHRQFRNIVNKAFTPRMVKQLEPRVRGMAKRIVDRVAHKGECDFVSEVAARLPMEVICEMMGVPNEDREHIYDLTNKLIGFDDPEFQSSPQDAEVASLQMFVYASKLAEKARKHPGEDLATALLHAEVDGEHLSELEFNSFFLLLAVAGNETTRTVTTNGMLALIQHPDQRRRLIENPKLIETGVEEILRFEPAVHYFRRTTTQDVEVRGQRIRKGDKITMWYPAANRDEEVFDRPDEFDIAREPNDHLAFGVGEHFCLGSNLARMELNVIFEELLRRIAKDIELAGPVRRLRSNFVNGVKEMRVRFEPETR